MDLWDSYLKTILITEVRFYSSGATCLVWFMESQLNTLSWGYYLALPLCESILKIHHGAFLWIPNSSFYTLHLSPKIVKVSWSCLTLCDPMDYTVHGILQARILEWVDFPFSKGSSQPRDWTQVSHIAGWFFTRRASREAQNTGVGYHPSPRGSSQPRHRTQVSCITDRRFSICGTRDAPSRHNTLV